MSEFSVNPGNLDNIAERLRQQAKALEEAGASIDSVRDRLRIEGSSKTAVRNAMTAASENVKTDAGKVSRLGGSLSEIASRYRQAEKTIVGSETGGGVSGGSYPGGAAASGAGSALGAAAQNGMSTGSCDFSHDPVNLSTGNFVLDNLDLEIPGFQPLLLRRFYNSLGDGSGILGRDWMLCFERKVTRDTRGPLTGLNVRVLNEDGREELFSSADGVAFVPSCATTSSLARDGEGYVYTTLEGDRYLYDADGRYLRYENARHVGYSLIYGEGRLERVQSDTGAFFTFSYDPSGLLSAAADHTGRTCRYLCEEGRLTKVVLADQSAWEYSYGPSGKIRRVLNPRKVGVVETEYDALFRVVHQTFADGTENSFTYLDAERAVVMTERNGTKSTHYYNEEYQNIRNVYTDGEESFTYNKHGQKTRIVDKRGNMTSLQYNNRGNLTGILTADKTKVSLTYNAINRLLSLSVNGKRKVSNEYNAFGELVSSEDGLGRRTSYSYDEGGRLTEVKLPDGSQMSAAYDERGNLSALKNTDGAVFSFSYDNLNRIVKETDPLGNTASYDYDRMGRMTCQTRPDGNARSFRYDEGGNVVSVTDYDGSRTETAYNENNKPVLLRDAAGRTTSIKYDPMWNIAEILLPNQGSFRFRYDAENRLETVRDTQGNETRYRYDPAGNMLARTDAEGNETAYEWDALGRCTRVTAPDGSATEFGYDGEGRLVFVKDAQGTERSREFDAAGQMVSEEDSLGQKRTYTYNEVGDLLSVTDETGRTTSYAYRKGEHRVAEILYPDGTRERFSYDQNGNTKTRTDRYGILCRFWYDELNRMVRLEEDGGRKREYRYDPMGRIVEEKDTDGNRVSYEYSATGQLLAVKDALGNLTRYSYDEMDGLTEVLRAAQAPAPPAHSIYERDLMGRVTRVTDALGNEETYQYDRLGKMTGKVDRDGNQTSYQYDCRGLLKAILWADGRSVEYGYDKLRRLTMVRDWTGVTRMEYDQTGHLLSIAYPDGGSLSFGYDAQGNCDRVRYPSGTEVAKEYDAFGRLTALTQEGRRIRYAYDPYGSLFLKELPDGQTVRYRYSARGELEDMTLTDDAGILDELSFGYDLEGRRTRFQVHHRDEPERDREYSYTYDPAGHLKQAFLGGRLLRAYSYDAVGNRSAMEEFSPLTGERARTRYEYDSRGALVRLFGPDRTEEYQYDRRGNLTQIRRDGELFRTFRYGAINRLTEAEGLSGRAVYEYNGLGYRVGRQYLRDGRSESASYVVDYGRIYDNLIEKTEDGKTESYLWGAGLEGFTGAASRGFFLTDPLGSVIRRTDTGKDGADSSSYVEDYDEFGNPASGSGIHGERFGYNGFLFDPVAGTFFAQARQYRSETGTFDAMDRFGGDITMPETLNPYTYCLQDPFRYTDKSAWWFGLDDAIAAGLGAVGGAVGQFFGDVIDGATTGDWNFSSLQEYAGAAIGGAAGGVTTLYAGPIAGGAVSAGVGNLTTEGLTYLSNPEGYDKPFWEVVVETAGKSLEGAASGAISKLGGKISEKMLSSKMGKGLISKLNSGGKLAQKLAERLNFTASGSPTKKWSQVTRILKNMHGDIAGSSAMLDKVKSIMWKNLPVYVWQEVRSKFIKKGTPVLLDFIGDLLGLSPVFDFIKERLSALSDRIKDWLGDFFGWSDAGQACAACS